MQTTFQQLTGSPDEGFRMRSLHGLPMERFISVINLWQIARWMPDNIVHDVTLLIFVGTLGEKR
jgi:hypothetical protein